MRSPFGDLVDPDDLEAVDRAPTIEPRASSTPAPAGARSLTRLLIGTFVVTSVVAASAGAYWTVRPAAPQAAVAPTTGVLVLSSHPDGAAVMVDGAERGTTPLVLTLPAGDHPLSVTLPDTEPAHLVASVSAAGEWRRHVTLAPLVAAPATTLRVETERAGAAVFVDGVGVGATPLALTTLPPGDHLVEVRGAGALTRRVTLTSGATTSLVLSGERPAATASGWLSVPSPVELQVVEDGRLLGVSRSERIMVPAGRHVLDLVNEPLGIRQRATVVVEPDRTASVRIDLPTAPLNVNALPWANVTIDDRAYGETPLANVALRVGEHEVTLRHPTLGEHTVIVTVRHGSPNRVSVDLRK